MKESIIQSEHLSGTEDGVKERGTFPVKPSLQEREGGLVLVEASLQSPGVETVISKGLIPSDIEIT